VLGGSIEKLIENVRENEALSDADKTAQIESIRAQWIPANEQVKAAGGLRIIGTERHESRRIDNQLRGRAGRQGDPGSSRFYLSLEDPLMRIFAGDRVRAIMDRLKLPEGEPIEAGMVSRSIETAQRKVEGRNFDVRKQLLEYDDVANDQRKVLYAQRNEVLEAQSIAETIDNLRKGTFSDLVARHVPQDSVEEQWDIDALQMALEADWQITLPLTDFIRESKSISEEDILEKVLEAAEAAYQLKVTTVGAESWAGFERSIMLQVIDTQWREHLSALDHLRQGIHLRGYAQKNPKQEYKREAFELFSSMLDRVRDDVVRVLMTVRIQTQEEIEQAELEAARAVQMSNVQYQHTDFDEAPAEKSQTASRAVAEDHPGTLRNAAPKIGRNDPCPCASGKKYKHCHGQLT
jgi:preprotein translocase subunit SecA